MFRPASVTTGVVVVALAVVAVAFAGGAAAQSSDKVTVEIQLVDDAGEGIGDADLTLSWDGGQTEATTFSNGKALADVPRGATVAVRIDHPTYMRNHPYVIPEAAEKTYTIEASRSGTVALTVRGAAGPIQDASVQLFQRGRTAASGRTDGDGQVSLGPVERGTYGVQVTKPGYITNGTTVNVTGDVASSVTIRPGAVQLGFNVTDDHFSPPQPVTDATITIQELGNTLRTLEDGDQTTSVPVNRVYTVEFTKSGYETVTRKVRVREASTVVDVRIQRTPALTLEMANDRVVVGETTRARVTNEYGEPVEGAAVAVGGVQAGTTDDQGHVDVPIDADGNQTVRATQGSLSTTAVVEGIEPGQKTSPSTTTTTGPTTSTTAPPTTLTTTTATSGGGPGFTPLAALLALVALAGIASRRG